MPTSVKIVANGACCSTATLTAGVREQTALSRPPVPFLLKLGRVAANPTKNGRVIDADLPLGQKARDIARRELGLEVPPDGDDDDLGEEMAPFE